MMPVPFQDVNFIDPDSQYKVQSKLGKNEKGERPLTEVFDKNGKSIWKMSVFKGRKRIQVSPEGSTLVLFGNYFYMSMINRDGDPEIAEVFIHGKSVKKIKFSDLYKESIADKAKEKGIPVVGGGWIPLFEFVKELKVEWKTKTLIFTLDNQTDKKIPYS